MVSILLALVPGRQYADPFVNDDMLNQLKSEFSEQAYRRGIAINNSLAALEGQDINTQLKEVNRLFNKYEYKGDLYNWGVKDYWATPVEFIGTNSGDCEDFVIAKYFALRNLGVADKQLYLTYVKALHQGVAHMVLSYFPTPSSIPLILDNYQPLVMPADQRKDLLPVYSFNAKSLFLTNSSAGLGRSLPTDKIRNSKWQKLLANIE